MHACALISMNWSHFGHGTKKAESIAVRLLLAIRLCAANLLNLPAE